MAVKIRLLRMGKIRQPQYRIVVADSRTKRDGRAIEYVGIYHPKEEPSRIEVKSDRVQYWLGVGAQPSDPVRAILSKTGDWQKFKGLPAPEPLKVAAPKRDKNALYEAEAKSVVVEDTKPDTPKKKSGTKKTESAKSAKADDKDKAEAKDDKAKTETKAKAKDDKAAEAKTETKAKDDKAAEAKTDAKAKDDKAAEAETTTETAKES